MDRQHRMHAAAVVRTERTTMPLIGGQYAHAATARVSCLSSLRSQNCGDEGDGGGCCSHAVDAEQSP